MDANDRAKHAKKWIVVERDKFRLTLWTREPTQVEGKEAKVYKVAIGKRFFRTPKMFSIVDTKDRTPEWTMPNSQWVLDAGLKPGTVLDDKDPNNPIKARWIGISNPGNGIGIHGTGEAKSIGTEASHGCIRMHPKDIIELFDKVPLGTPVYVD